MKIRKGYFRFTLALSISVGIIIPLYQGWFFDKSEVDISLPENWKQMPIQEKINNFDKILLKDSPFFLLDKIKQFKIRRQLKKMIVDKEDIILRDGFNYSFSFRFYIGWEELSLLGMVGFASVWVIYALARVVILSIPYTPVRHFPLPPSKKRLESLKFPILGEPASSDSVRKTPVFLAPEELPKRPRKPGAVWID
jgi:hypothetical protein